MREAILTRNSIHGNVEFMKDWPFWGWIAYGCLAISAYGIAFAKFAAEYPAMYDWLPLQIRWYLGYVPATLVSIATIILIIQWVKAGKAIEINKSTTVPPPSSVSPSSPILAKPKKFYSQRNKSDLANALTDLLEIFNRDGSELIPKAQHIIEEWRPLGIQDRIRGKKPPDISISIDQLNEISNLAATLYQQLFEDNGFIKKYLAYSDELCPILQVHEKPSNTPNQPLIELQGGINYFRNMLTPIKLAEKYNDLNLTTWMMTNTSSTFNNFQHKVNAFRTWIDNTKKQIAAFRNAHLS